MTLHPCTYYLYNEVKKTQDDKCCGLINHFPLGKTRVFKKCLKCEMYKGYKDNYNGSGNY